ncbi:MAG: J domain-containing protein [Methylocystis sp.]|uniref:J domain-containing protein n=1 Tax=Methylocystis sp. TaxID=1911079 RepID=UPI003DA1CEF6
MQTHHDILGIRDDASRREINAAYRKLAKKYHPDVEGGDSARFQLVTDAYNALTVKPTAAPVETRRRSAPVEAEPPPVPGMRQWLFGFLRRRAFAALSVFAFLLGLFLLDWGDGIHEDFTPGLLLAGSLCILLSIGFFANRGHDYSDLADAVERAIISVARFLFDMLVRVYLMMVLVFAVVSLLALINWLKKHFLHFLPVHF